MKPAPVHLWNPPYCGEIDLIIKSDGTWIHEGAVIRRQKLIELFSSILTLGSDREFYLVSPHEKVRIKVEHHPFVIQKIDIEGEQAVVTREVDGGLQTIKINMPAVITTDLRLNEPRYASLPNIMKAKKKPIDQKSPADFGIDISPRLTVLKVVEPPKRQAGIKVESVSELVEKLKNEAGVI